LFIIILLLYIHIVHQYKTSEDLEIYEFDYENTEHLQEVCNIKQPAVFKIKNIIPDFFENINIDNLDKIGKSEMKVKESQDYWIDKKDVDYILLPYHTTRTLLKTDTHQNYITENNDFFIEEDNLQHHFTQVDELLKQSSTINKRYDILMGADKANMPFRYHTNDRYFVCVNSGKIRIKLSPWKSSRYLYPSKDYELYEFKSPINVWKPQRTFFNEMDKLKFLEFDIPEGNVVYIPPYWWYSIQYLSDSTLLTGFTYNTIINYAANIKDIGLYFLQQNNIKTKMTKSIDLNQMNELSNPIPLDDDGKIDNTDEQESKIPVSI
jgi:hypothetical protein